MVTKGEERAQLCLNILGGFNATLNGEPLSHFYSDKVRALFAYLAMAGQTPIRREILAARLWPRYIPHSQRVNLRRAIYELKRNTAPFPLLVTTHQTISLSKEALQGGLLCDARALVDKCEDLEGSLASGDSTGIQDEVRALRQASRQSICNGLSVMNDGADGFGEWCDEQMAALRERVEILVSRAEEIRESSFAGNLPGQITPIIGRQRELVALKERITPRSHRLLTLTGLGGVGKSRLALATAHQNQDQFPNGAWWIEAGTEDPFGERDGDDLASPAQAGDLATRIRAGLGLDAQPATNDTKILGDHLRGKKILIVLDGLDPFLKDSCLAQTSSLLVGLLSASPGLVILTTSRRNIPVSAATPMKLEGLSYPGAHHLFMGEGGLQALLDTYEAPRLFIERSNIGPLSGTLKDEDTKHLIELCQLTEGLPIAIELAAALHREFSIPELAKMIRLNPMGLEAPLLDVSHAHRTLSGLLVSSLEGLSEGPKLALISLTKLEGTFTSATADNLLRLVLDEEPETHVLLSQLAERSLLNRVGPGRWRMHCLIRSLLENPAARPTLNLKRGAALKRPATGGGDGGVGIGHEGHYPWFVPPEFKLMSRRRRGGVFHQLMG